MMMAVLPTPQESARKVLHVFVSHFNCRPGDVLQKNNLMVCMTHYQMRSEDLASGLEYAEKMGWLEATDRGGVRLTEAGFLAA